MRRLLVLPLLLPSAAFADGRPGPIQLDDEQKAAELCSQAARRPPIEDEDPVEAGKRLERWAKEQEAVFSKVYRAVVEPTSVEFETYVPADRRLPLDLDHSLLALDGALVLSVMDRRGAAFTLKEEEARGIVRRAQAKQIRLGITFQIDSEYADELSPCFSYPKSATYSLRIIPLSYELLDAGGHALARVRTDRMEELSLARTPGTLRIRTRVVDGVVDHAKLATAVETRRGDMEACLTGARKGGGEESVIGLIAAIENGKIVGARQEIEATEDPEAAHCLARALEGVKPPQASRGARIGVVVQLERGRSIN